MKSICLLVIISVTSLFAETTHYGRVCYSEADHKASADASTKQRL